METYFEILLKTKRIISFEEYLELIKDHEDYKIYSKYFIGTTSKNTLFEGMLKWPDDDSPENWAGPFPLNYVIIRISKSNTTKTEVDVFNSMLNSEKRSTYNRLGTVLDRVGFGREYWIRPLVYKGETVSDQLCTYSTMTDEELSIVEAAETPEEHLYYQQKVIRNLSSKDSRPKNQDTIEHPYRIYLAGNDDYSYTMYYKPEKELDILSLRAYIFLKEPCWHHVEDYFFFSN